MTDKCTFFNGRVDDADFERTVMEGCHCDFAGCLDHECRRGCRELEEAFAEMEAHLHGDRHNG